MQEQTENNERGVQQFSKTYHAASNIGVSYLMAWGKNAQENLVGQTWGKFSN